VRLFFAVHLSDEALVGAANAAASARVRRGADAYRWVSSHLFHVTLAFLGEQPEEALPDLAAIAQETAAAHEPFRLQLGAPGSFGPSKEPRVIWIGLAGGLPKLRALQADLSDRLRADGFLTETAKFSPHITVARLGPKSRPVGVPLPLSSKLPLRPWSVTDFALVRSQLTRPEPTYTDVQRWSLEGGATRPESGQG
jgi:2'-5' RNA ligase